MNFLHKSYKITIFFCVAILLWGQAFHRVYPQSEIGYTRIEIRSDSAVYFTGPPFSPFFANDFLFGKKYFKIPAGFNNIFFGIERENSSMLYSYKLEGLNKTWTTWLVQPSKEYTGLKPGRYRFRVRTIDRQGSLAEYPPFQFRVLAPFYRSWMTRVAFAGVGILFLLSLLRSWRYSFAREKYRLEKIINERTEEMIREKDKTETLLANVLPKDTADELKKDGKVTKKKFRMVTVLFSDIQGFTRIAEQMNPETLIDELDKFFFHFDSVVEKYNIEKIKTIGDAYMCAGGIPDKNRTNPVEVVLAALEMQRYMKELREKTRKENRDIWDIRIGIHTGPVIAGVVGQKKLSYDIWGDTVNTASRMESSGEPGKINVSGSTYELIKDYFICEYRGKMPVKYKGEIDMYFVKGIRPEMSVEINGLPNERFFLQLHLLRLLDLEEDLIERMEEGLPENLYFHNVKHTVNVYTQVELLGRALGVSDEEMLLLRTAGLLHDAGMLQDYEHHEAAASELARILLPKYGFDERQIRIVCELIMSTVFPPDPKNTLEQIMCDADLDYLGRVDYVTLSLLLYREQVERNPQLDFEQWKNEQIRFLQRHEFYTEISRRLRDVSKAEQVRLLKASRIE